MVSMFRSILSVGLLALNVASQTTYATSTTTSSALTFRYIQAPWYGNLTVKNQAVIDQTTYVTMNISFPTRLDQYEITHASPTYIHKITATVAASHQTITVHSSCLEGSWAPVLSSCFSTMNSTSNGTVRTESTTYKLENPQGLHPYYIMNSRVFPAPLSGWKDPEKEKTTNQVSDISMESFILL